MPVIDIHTHMLTLDWIELLRAHGGGRYGVKKTPAGQDAVHLYDAPFMTLMPGMWDYDLRIENMDKAGVDLAVVSLTCPNVFWGGRDVSLRAARMVNDSMAEQQRARPDRIRWFASLPWQFADDAKHELARCTANGAVGVMVLGSIDGKDLIDPQFAPIWSEIDRLGLPVLVHPTAPQGVREMHMEAFNLIPPVGVIKDKPSSYLQRLYYDTVIYEQDALELCIKVAGSADNVLYGSDYPHNIGDMAGCLARVNALPGAAAKKVAGGNAQRIFRL
jgi:aminocarboxymuconate-semialdehyde decarboxylase